MIDTIARRAAARLGPSLDPNLPASLERAIANEGRTDRQRSFDAGVSLALAAFLLNSVQFGWKIYRDLKDDREKKQKAQEKAGAEPRPRELLLRRMRLALGEPHGLSTAQRDQLLEVVAEEILVTEDSAD
jgi:hypothetical protein